MNAKTDASSYRVQVFASLIAAILIVTLTIGVVTSKLGPGEGDHGRGRGRSGEGSGEDRGED